MKLLKTTTVAAVSAALLLGACSDSQLLSNSDPNANTKSAAIMGGLLGAGIGAVSNSSHKTTAVLGGAAVGALAGAAIGQSLDRQAAELRQQLANDGITVVNTGDQLVLTLPTDITFATDSFTVRPALRADLNTVSQHLLRYPDMMVQVIGHTDSDGDAAYNVGLSQRRASAVANILQANGVPYTRLTTIGRGEEVPIASNLTAEGKARNRRVEIVMIPTK
ncbi:OmpA family protein [Pseudodonghicola flavimaris]|uniref:OmpA family protein n=1 Tax=Pseudodonghicola flavimaris TaxID=3050036 RepID=A0ABT7EWE8_9RHOB|nr:OmpA family protein [Pseudodonghicola flavimaris]MDK3016619.1 OmpA family protein [Pseudodonghicola flavimaris]